MNTVRHEGRSTAYRMTRSADTGPVMLYVHGSGGTHQLWSHQYGATGPAHPAAAVDLSGHGASDDVDTEPGSATLDAYAADVIAVAEAIDADILVGNSLGGAVAQWIALQANWSPSAMVLTGTGPTLPVFEGLRGWLETDFEQAVSFLHGRDRLFHDTDIDAVTKSREQMDSVGQAVTRRDFLTCHQFDVAGRLSEINVPVLAICGEHDKLTPRSYHEQLAHEIPNAELAFVPDAAHLAMVEQPSMFNEILNEFITAKA